jgi:putative hydrolase of the HAD superfamily
MVLLYEQLATKYGSPVYLDTVRKIESLSSIILSPPILYDDTIPFLDRMSQLGHLCLVTAGDYNVQSAKVRASGLAHYFKGIYILPTKTTETVKPILESLGVEPSNCWFIGNSPRSDALPAIKLGMKAILVQRQTWAYDDIPQEERELLSSLHKASTLLEAYSIVLSNTKES